MSSLASSMSSLLFGFRLHEIKPSRSFVTFLVVGCTAICTYIQYPVRRLRYVYACLFDLFRGGGRESFFFFSGDNINVWYA